MNTQLKRTIALTLAAISQACIVQAQTVITGPNINTSTWGPAGNPYIVTANCTVPSGQTLVIQPGTVVWMAEGTSLTCNGMISAVGTAALPIAFAPPVSSQMWNTIIINNTSGTNRFVYCNFVNATNALDFRGASKNAISDCTFSNATTGVVFRDNSINSASFCTFQSVTNGIWMTIGSGVELSLGQTSTILNCSFTNCSSQAIYGEAYGAAGYIGGTQPHGWSSDATINATVKNCSFLSRAVGVNFHVRGVQYSWFDYGTRYATGYGHGNVVVQNCVFDSPNVAIGLSSGSWPGSSSASLLNNTIKGAVQGASALNPWDARIQNNIFVGCTTAITRSGTLSLTVSYNGLFGNTVNFSGFPATYGQILLANRNGTACDLLYNIFSDPMLTSASDFHLQTGSPCIDAGESSGANLDSYFPPSLGTTFNDVGAYGGPNAGQWIVPTSTNAFTLGITKVPYVSVTINPPSAGQYRLEYSSTVLGTNNWIQITNMALTTVPFTYTEPATTPARFYRAVKL